MQEVENLHDDKKGYRYKTAQSAQRANNAPGGTKGHNITHTQTNTPTQNTQNGMRAIRNSQGNTQELRSTQTGIRTAQNQQQTGQVRTQKTALRDPRSIGVPNAESTVSRAKKWLQKTYKVDKNAIEERNAIRLSLVREKGSIDYVFFVLVLLLLAFGTVMVYSASYAYSKTMYDNSYYIITRQFVFVAIGLLFMFITSRIPPEFLRKVSPFVFIGCFLMLCIVPIPIPGFTMSHNGARRWINLGFIEIQPSEFMKLGLAMMLAWYFDRYYERIVEPAKINVRRWYGVITPLFITGMVCVLVLIEKHLSGTIIMALIGIIIIFSSGAPSLWMLPGMGAGLGIVGLLIAILPHARKRFQVWLDPWLDPQNAGYQTLQGLFAIGSGGLFGEGLGNSYQKHMYVSQPQNDFIFVIVCEELGFIGAVAVIILFALLVWRGLVVAMNAPDVYSQLLVMGIVGKIAIQSVLNMAVVTNSVPNTGISLPFFSYGGSSLIVLLAEMGIVLSISRYSKHKK